MIDDFLDHDRIFDARDHLDRTAAVLVVSVRIDAGRSEDLMTHVRCRMHPAATLNC